MINKNEYYSYITESSGSIVTCKIMEKSRWYEPHPIHKNILDKIYREVDGLYYFDTGEGMIAAHTMREIADKLDYINKDWPKNSFKSK